MSRIVFLSFFTKNNEDKRKDICSNEISPLSELEAEPRLSGVRGKRKRPGGRELAEASLKGQQGSQVSWADPGAPGAGTSEKEKGDAWALVEGSLPVSTQGSPGAAFTVSLAWEAPGPVTTHRPGLLPSAAPIV